jgi:hypothetical protein
MPCKIVSVVISRAEINYKNDDDDDDDDYDDDDDDDDDDDAGFVHVYFHNLHKDCRSV